MIRFRRFEKDEGGAALAEIALWMTAITLPFLNAVDLGIYVFQRMQVEAAAHAAVNAAWHDCDATLATPAPPPAITTCKAVATNVITHMQSAAQSTSLGTAVTLPTASISEGYYCANATGALTRVANLGTAAAPVSPAPAQPKCGTSTTLAGDYVIAQVAYTYAPIFKNVSILTLTGGQITRSAWMRLDK